MVARADAGSAVLAQVSGAHHQRGSRTRAGHLALSCSTSGSGGPWLGAWGRERGPRAAPGSGVRWASGPSIGVNMGTISPGCKHRGRGCAATRAFPDAKELIKGVLWARGNRGGGVSVSPLLPPTFFFFSSRHPPPDQTGPLFN